MAEWRVASKKANFDEISKKYGISPVVARIIRNREIVEDADIYKFLNGSMEDLYAPLLLKGMRETIDILKIKIQEKKKIRVIGDYDVDGICSTYILYKGIAFCGGVVDYRIPHRQKDGYGLNKNLVQKAYEDGIDTIITCDNGIAAKKELAYATELGMTAIVTDHHEVPFSLDENENKTYKIPEVAAVIDPKQPGDTYPYPGICGGVVVYKVIQQLIEEWNIEESKKQNLMEELLEFAGIATICDVMEIMDENRILVKYALQHIKNTKNKGLSWLMKVNEIDCANLASYHIGFIIGPCFNASGRLESAVKVLELLLCEEESEAARMAHELKDLNTSRKELTEQGTEEAFQIIQRDKLYDDKVIVVYLPQCHESLAGIIAGRVREMYYRPTFILTKGEDSVKGSARSIEQYNLYEEMCKCEELFIKFGGHKLAAGLSLEEKDIENFKNKINRVCLLGVDDFVEKIIIDVPMPFSYVTEELIAQLEVLEPFGVKNPKPIFAQRKVSFLSGRKMGKTGNVGKYIVADENGNKFETILFRNIDEFDQCIKSSYGEEAVKRLYSHSRGKEDILLHLIYYPSINEYRGKRTVQFVIQDYKGCDS